jgi:hypothetical protein
LTEAASGPGARGRRGSRTPPADGGSPQSVGLVAIQRRERSRSFHQVPSGVRLKNRPRPPIATCATTCLGEYRRTLTALAMHTPDMNAAAAASQIVTTASIAPSLPVRQPNQTGFSAST